MIGYRTSKADLEAEIEKQVPGWIALADARTEQFRTAKHYREERSIWSKVKHVYMRLQGEGKCAYCERKLESVELGKIEQDVEHFRPKSSVKAWKAPPALKKAGITLTAVPKEGRGYYLLPYHRFNYSAACKPCNSVLKRDFFPIAGKYDLDGDDPVKLAKEKPYLLCPIGDFDDKPEDLIQFYGLSPQPVAVTGHARARALVTIHLFQLADETKRKNLFRERAAIIAALYPQLEKLASGATGRSQSDAQEIVDGFTATFSAHNNCARSYVALFNSDPAEAKAVFDRARKVLLGIS